MRRSTLRSAVLVTALTVGAVSALPATAWAGKGGGGKSSADRIAPTVTIGSPAAGATVAAPFTVTGSAYDDRSVSKVVVSLDGGSPTNATGTATWSWSSPSAADGSHTVRATAYDTSGNTVSTSVTVTVASAPSPDTTAPTVAFTSPASDASVSGAFAATGTAGDDRGLSSVQVQVDGGSLTPASGTTSWSVPLDATGWTVGTHTLTAQALDTSGNLQTSTTLVTVASTTTTSGPDIALADPSASNGLQLLGRGRAASWGSVSVLLYWEESTTHRGLFVRDASNGATSYVTLPTDNQNGWGRAAYSMTSATDLWVLGGSGPLSLRHFVLSGNGIPTSAALVSNDSFGDADSRVGDLLRLADGGLVLAWLQQGALGPQGQWVAYLAPGSTSFQVVGPLQFIRTKASKAVLVQHPSDGSIWLLSDPDAWGAIGAAHLSQSAGTLRVDWTDAMWISTGTYGEMGPDPENPDLAASPDPTTGDIVLAYQGAHRTSFAVGTARAVGSYPVVARIPALGTPTFAQLPTYVERISSLSLSVRDGDVRLTYRPVDPATATFDRLASSLLRAGTWGAPTSLGQLWTSWEVLSFSSNRMETWVRLADGRLHLFTF